MEYNTITPKPALNRSTFWDTDIETLDFEQQAKAIIKRVFEYGTWEEILEVNDYYSEAKIEQALINTPALRLRAISLASAILGIPKDRFYSYKNRPSYLP